MRSTITLDFEQVTSDVIKTVIEKHSAANNKMIGLYKRFNGEGIPIQTRQIPGEDRGKPNNKLVNDFRGLIVNQTVGYLLGEPISYSLDQQAYNVSQYKEYKELLNKFTLRNMIEDIDAELLKLMSICGYATRLLYVDKDGIERITNVKPFEVVFIKSNSGHYAMRYYQATITKDGKEQEVTKVEWYDNKNITFYIEDEDEYILDKNQTNPLAHMFQDVPFILFKNNEEEKGDFENVEPLIDAYDKVTSDAVNEVETFANAYMKFKGVSVDDETIKSAKTTGAFEVDADGDVGFITKDINDTFVENIKKTLKYDIHKFSASIDTSDEQFSGGAQTGESRKWKMYPLENKVITKERKFTAGLREQFRVLATAWQTKGIQIDYLDIFMEFKRNIPVDLTYIADYASKMKGIHSDHTLLANIPYIDDVAWEIEQMKDEQEEKVDINQFTPDGEEDA